MIRKPYWSVEHWTMRTLSNAFPKKIYVELGWFKKALLQVLYFTSRMRAIGKGKQYVNIPHDINVMLEVGWMNLISDLSKKVWCKGENLNAKCQKMEQKEPQNLHHKINENFHTCAQLSSSVLENIISILCFQHGCSVQQHLFHPWTDINYCLFWRLRKENLWAKYGEW